MARRYRFWTKEQKLEMIMPVMECKITIAQQSKKYEISEENIIKWIKRYKADGIDGLENKRKPGNPLAKYINKKHLTDIEKLEYENMQLRIENERLKKGYLVKGDGTVQISTLSKKKNSK
jgi:transposase-like protein